jgi:hypothetical protein
LKNFSYFVLGFNPLQSARGGLLYFIKTHIQGLEIQVLLIKVGFRAGSEWWKQPLI